MKSTIASRPSFVLAGLCVALLSIVAMSPLAGADDLAASQPASTAAVAAPSAAISTGPAEIAAAAPASAPAASQAVVEDPAQMADKAVQVAVKDALAGKFDAALDVAQKAAKAGADGDKLSLTVNLLNGFETSAAQAEAERLSEYRIAVQQVQRALFAEVNLPKLPADVQKELRLAVLGQTAPATSQPASGPATSQPASMAAATSGPTSKPAPNGSLVAAFNRSATSEGLLNAVDDQAALKLQTNSIKALDDARADLKKALTVLAGTEGEYPVAFRELAARLDKQLSGYAKVWASIDVTQEKTRVAGAKQLRKLEDDVLDALTELEAMVSEKPWLMAMNQARMAMQLVPRKDRDAVLAESWYKTLITEIEAMGRQRVAKGDWYEAMSIYANLQELSPDVESYREMSRIAQRHVRVLRLYGPKTGATSRMAAEAAAAGDEAEPGWKELVSGVDMEMVRAAISQLDVNYVTAPDYKKLTRGALQAIKVLAETTAAANSFPAIADEQKRKSFVEALDQMADNVQQMPTVNHQTLQLTLNNVRDASERTVQIPPDVLAVEYADGFLEELDKFSSMIWPYEVADFTKQTMGQFFGVGIQIGKEPGEPLKVVSPLEDSPAYKAGIKSGDLILSVDGVRTEPLTVDALVKKITGPKGTKVVLQVKRQGTTPYDVPLIREEIRIRTIKGWQRRDGGEWDYIVDPVAKIGYVRLTQFTDQTAPELQATLEDLAKQGVHSLILDLRFNPGGLLRSAGSVADEFLRQGRIVSTEGRQSGKSEINAKASGNYLDGDLVVLVNQYSASAAEIVAGALKDWHRAVVVGQRTYGKGSVQNVIPVSGRRAVLKATTAYYYLPSGRCLHRKNGDTEWGVDPDVDVMLTPRQTRRWLDIRRRTDLLQDFDQAQLKSDMADQFNADMQMSAAVTLLKLMQMKDPSSPAAVATEAK